MEGRWAIDLRTGKVLAICRALIAVVFLIALWIEPVSPARPYISGYGLLYGYLLWSTALVLIAWNSWWFDFRLAKVIHSIDIVAIVIAVLGTEAGHADFGSPFMALAAYLLCSAGLRWGRSAMICTATAIFAFHLLTGLSFHLLAGDHVLGLHYDAHRFIRRAIYLAALSTILVWLYPEQIGKAFVQIPEHGGIPGKRGEKVIAAVLACAREIFDAGGAAIALTCGEEPWIDLFIDTGKGLLKERIGPEGLIEELVAGCPPVLFDRRADRRIIGSDVQHAVALNDAFAYPLATLCEVGEGLLVGFGSGSTQGQLLVWALRDAGAEDLATAAALAREAGQAIDLEAMSALAQSEAISQVRLGLARDLHDSVAQFLSGTLFRLQSLRRRLHDGDDPEPEILAIKDALRVEQRHVSSTIEQLRTGTDADQQIDVAQGLNQLVDELGYQWQVDARFFASVAPMPVSMGLAHELRQIVSEAVANAVRHGKATKVEMVLASYPSDMLDLTISDNGSGFPGRGSIRPRSICERVTALGGNVSVSNTQRGALIRIEMSKRMFS